MAEEQKGRIPQESGEMPFLDHLEELRWRLIKALAAITVGCVLGYLLVTRLDVIGFLRQPIDPFLPPGQRLLFTAPIEPFMLTLKLAFVSGVIIAAPVVLWQTWAFLRPALYRSERKAIVPVALLGIALFIMGAALAFYVVMPFAIKVLFGFQSESLTPFITADKYFSFTTMIVLSFGAVFELPLILVLLVYLRILSAGTLRRHRRLAVVVNAILAAFLTPGDLVIMTVAVMVPIQLFYELSIALAVLIERRRRRREREETERDAAEAGGDMEAPAAEGA